MPGIQDQVTEIRNSFPDFKSFTTRFAPGNQAAAAQHPTRCVTSASAPTLTYIDLAYGEGCAIAWLVIQLTHFQLQINVPNKMTEMQLETCAQTIFDNYRYLKATEIMLFLARLTGGMYPVEWFGYITPDRIVTALRDHFMVWRNELLYKMEKQERERKRNEERKAPPPTEEEQAKINEIRERLMNRFKL